MAKLPSRALLVAAADSRALGPFRPAIEAARPFMPRSLDCVVDAALTGETVALAVEPGVGTTVVIITRAHVARCPALSRVAGDTYIATIGAGSVAATAHESPLGDPRWSRARTYLVNDPIALAVDGAGQRVVAVAQPRPLAGWLTIDAVDIAPVQRDLRAWLEHQRTTAIRPVVDSLVVQARSNQLLVRTTKLEPDQLALLATAVLRSLDAPAEPVAAATFTCPPSGPDVVRCTDHTRVVVRSLATTLHKLAEVTTQPVIAGGDVIGIRLSEDADVLLRRSDVILGLDGHRITSAAQLQELARYVHERTSLAIRRDGTDVIIELSE